MFHFNDCCPLASARSDHNHIGARAGSLALAEVSDQGKTFNGFMNCVSDSVVKKNAFLYS